MTRNEYSWEHKQGRDQEGDRFDTEVLIHGSGRILARIKNPTGEEYYWRVYFYVPKSVMDSCDDGHDFISLDSAVEFVELTVARWPEDMIARISARMALTAMTVPLKEET